MSQVKRSFLNMSWLMASQIISSVCAFVWTVLIARYLGVSNLGILGFAISVSGIFAIATDLGISTHIVRKISTDYDIAPKYLGNAIPLKTIFFAVSFAILTVLLFIFGYDEFVIIITLLFAIEMAIGSMYALFYGSFQSIEKGKYQAIGNTFLNILLLIFIIISIFSDWGLMGIAIAYLVSNIIVFIFLYIMLEKHVAVPEYELDKEFCIKLTKISLPFAFFALFQVIYYSIDMVMLTSLVGDYATGLYNASYKLINVLTLFYGIYTAVVFPVMSKFYKNDESLLSISFEKSVKYLSFITIPMAIFTVIYAKDIILLVYGSKFVAASPILSILIWTVMFLFINGVCAILLNASHREVSVTKIYGIAAVFNVVMNLIFIPQFSYIGAAVTTVVTNFLILVLALYVLNNLGHLPGLSIVKDILKIVTGSIILGIVLYYLNLSLFAGLAIGIVVYLVVMLALRIIDDGDKYIFNEILGRN